jgi:hypothetical protein
MWLYGYIKLCRAIGGIYTSIKGCVVGKNGFEPLYSERTDLQSVAFNHSATSPTQFNIIALTAFSVKFTAPHFESNRHKKGSMLLHRTFLFTF